MLAPLWTHFPWLDADVRWTWRSHKRGSSFMTHRIIVPKFCTKNNQIYNPKSNNERTWQMTYPGMIMLEDFWIQGIFDQIFVLVPVSICASVNYFGLEKKCIVHTCIYCFFNDKYTVYQNVYQRKLNLHNNVGQYKSVFTYSFLF